MSTKNVNGKLLYSLEEVSYQFISHNKNKETMYKFIDAMTVLDIMDRVTIRYNKSNKYHYVLSDWFKELIEGHYYTEEVVRKGKKVNGPLYFDGYAAIILERLYLYYIDGKVKNGKVLETVYKIIAYTAPGFIEPIFPTDEPEEFIENIDYPEQLLNSLKMDMNNGITNVNKSKEKTLTKNQYIKISNEAEELGEGWLDDECLIKCKKLDEYFNLTGGKDE